MSSYGFTGTNLYVDLTSGTITKEPLDQELVRDYIGGLGYASRLLYDLVPAGIDPFSPENRLIFAMGSLLGTLTPAAARVYALSKSPLSGLMGTTNGGHSVGIMLKYSGYDSLIISGRAEKPVYIKVFDDNVEILDASHLWGKDTWQTVDILRDELGHCSVSCIGPAGENLVRFANIRNDKRSGFNKTGLGAVMGSKNLKAIASYGTKGIKIADRGNFHKITDEIFSWIVSSKATTTWRQYSAAAFVPELEGFSREEFRQRVKGRTYACLACPLGCKAMVNLRDGVYAGLTFYNSSLPSLVGHHEMARVENWDELAKCAELENRYGVDGAAIAGLVHLMAQLRDNGVITDEDTDGLALTYGGETIRTLIPLIAYKKGIGALLAEGVKGAAARIGKGAERYANHVKGIHREPNFSKEVSTGAFGSATNPRGSHGDRSGFQTGIAKTNPQAFRDQCLQMGIPESALSKICDDPGGYNVARLTKWAEDFNTVPLSMGICNRAPIMIRLNLYNLTALYEAATGIKTTPAALLEAGERTWNLQKLFNVRHGWTRKDDIPNTCSPDEPIQVQGKPYRTFNQLLDEYYQERGWDVKTGIPSSEKLTKIGLGKRPM